jgi:hypothetical protein
VTGEIMEAVRAFFDADDWRYEMRESSLTESGLLVSGFTSENGRTWRLYAYANDEDGLLSFYSYLEQPVPEEKRLVVAELLTRANSGIIIGNFELDFSDGQVRFKTSIDLSETTDSLTQTQVGHLVWRNVLVVDRWYPAIMAVLHGDRSPEEAVEVIEEDS